MPELPDLEVICGVLAHRLTGRRIVSATVLRPLVVRPPAPDVDPEGFLIGRVVTEVSRRGKFLLFALGEDAWMAVNPMLAGRLHYNTVPASRRRTRDYLVMGLDDGAELVYHDTEGMGKIYLTKDLVSIPGYAGLGPEPLDPNLTLAEFRERLSHFRGEIKGVLTRGALVAGIGNAYADEILFEAGIFPMRRSTRLSAGERAALYEAIRRVLRDATEDLRERMGEEIHVILRDRLRVHNRRGELCPRCGNVISEVKVAGRATSFCRRCQPGTMFD